jgi:hypothetical protein
MTFRNTNIFLLVLFLLMGCSAHRSRIANRDKLAYLFNHASRVQLLSYVNRMGDETPLIEGEEQKPVQKDTAFFVVDDLRIPESTIKERLILNNTQRDSLFRLFNENMCKIDGVAICYNPRHAVIFVDQANHAFGYIELCFDCTNYQTPGNFQLDFCYEKGEALKAMFQSFGINYFGGREF